MFSLVFLQNVIHEQTRVFFPGLIVLNSFLKGLLWFSVWFSPFNAFLINYMEKMYLNINIE